MSDKEETKSVTIEELTPEMKERIPTVRDEWIKIGLCTDNADKAMAVEGVNLAYKAAGLEPPKTVEWVSSPFAGAKLAAQWVACDKPLPMDHKDLPEVSPSDIRNQLYNGCYGQHSAGRLSFYAFFQPYLPDIIEPLQGQMLLAKSVHWWWPYEECCILCDRPEYFKRDDERRLHCEDGPAILYRDGKSLYRWHGTRIPSWVIEEPDKLTPKAILEESNQEVRRAMIEKFGMAKFLLDSGAKILQEDERGKLISFAGMDGGSQEEKFVLVQDSTHDHELYALCVPPDTETARQGVARTFGMEADEYDPIQET